MPKSKYRKISNISGDNFSFQNPYSLPERLKRKINKINSNLGDSFILEIENAITTYKFEEAVFRRAPTYTDIRIQLDEISLQSEMLYENLSRLFPGARSFLLQSHIATNKDYKYLSTLIKELEALKETCKHSVLNLKGKRGRPTNAFAMLLIAQLARSCLKKTDITPSQTNSSFMSLVNIVAEVIGNPNLKDIVAEALEQVSY